MKAVIFCLLVGLTLTYNAGSAVSYARKYCRNYNPKYHNYASSGGDCANFVSQCLVAGGMSFSNCGGKDNKGMIPYVPNLENCLSNNGWKKSYGRNGSFRAGYPFFIPGSHAMIATSVNGGSLTFCGHTNDRCDSSMGFMSNWAYYYL